MPDTTISPSLSDPETTSGFAMTLFLLLVDLSLVANFGWALTMFPVAWNEPGATDAGVGRGVNAANELFSRGDLATNLALKSLSTSQA